MARSGAAAFINGLTNGYELGRKMYKDYELGQVMSATPEEATGYTAQDGEQLKAMAEAKDENGKPYYTIGNDDKGNYTVTPNFGEDPKQIVMQQGTRTSFLGQDYDGTLTPEKMSAIRNSKMADVLAKYDPLQAEAIRRGNKQAELTDIQIKGAERQDRLAQRQEDQQNLMDNINNSVSEYARSRVKPDANGHAPDFTHDDFYEISKERTRLLADNGLFDQAQASANTALQYYGNKLEVEKKQREQDVGNAVALASRGDYKAAINAYNKYLPDGFTATDVVKNNDGSYTVNRVDSATGKPAAPMQISNDREFLAGLQSLTDSKALLAQKQQEFMNQIQMAQLKVQQGHLAVSQGQLGVSQGQLAETQKNGNLNRFVTQSNIALRNAAASAYEDGNMSDAQGNAIRAGITLPSVIPKGTGTDIKVDQMGNIVAEQKRSDGSAVVNTYTAEGKQRGSITIPAPVASGQNPAHGSSGTTLKNVSQEDIAATAKKYNISEEEVKRRLNIK